MSPGTSEPGRWRRSATASALSGSGVRMGNPQSGTNQELILQQVRRYNQTGRSATKREGPRNPRIVLRPGHAQQGRTGIPGQGAFGLKVQGAAALR